MPDQERIYIGNVVLDESNQEMLRQWLIDIVNSLQGHGNGFDADTLDGFHATDFATYEQGLKADNALQSGILIGSTPIENIPETQYILTDGVRIDEEVYNALANAFHGELEENLLLSTFLVKLYQNYQTQINALDEKKVDKIPGKGLSTHDFNDNYKEMMDSLALSFTELICPRNTNPSQQYIKRALNADSVNHLQFILTTEEIYAQYTNDVKNAWNNIFIFVEEANYPDDYESPLDCPIDTGYMFRIDDRGSEVWLQYKGRLAKNWLDMVRITDLYAQFLQYGNFESIMNAIAQTVASGLIEQIDTPQHINSLITRITPPDIDHWQDYPFLSSELDFVYDVIHNNRSLCYKNDNGFLIADISSITTDINNSLDQLRSAINNLPTNTTLNNYLKKTDVDNALKSNSTNPVQNSVIKNSIDTLTDQYNTLNTQISNLNTNISNLTETLNQSRRYDKFLVMGCGKYQLPDKTASIKFTRPTDQNQDILGAYDLTPDENGRPKEARITVTNRGSVVKASNHKEYYYSDPDYIFARVIQEHTGISGTEFSNPYIYFQVNGVGYARQIAPGTDYATLNIRLNAGSYPVTAIYIDTSSTPERPIYAAQQILVEDNYPYIK